MRILLTGTTGKIGGYLQQSWQDSHQVITATRATADLSNSSSLEQFLEKTDFDLLVNPAAVSTPEGCESAPELAQQVNVTAPALMARICARKKVPLIHFSTDYVLDGTEPGFKDESSPCLPNNLYGETKLAGERAVMEAHPDALIARVSWVFGSAGEGFLEKIFRLIQEGAPLEGVDDKYSLPTSSCEIAKALEALVAQSSSGLFHLTQTSEQPVSWYRYAVEVANAVAEIGLTPEPLPVTPRQMADIPVLRTNRPVHTAMTPARLQTIGYHPQNWKTLLRARVKALAQTSTSPL